MAEPLESSQPDIQQESHPVQSQQEADAPAQPSNGDGQPSKRKKRDQGHAEYFRQGSKRNTNNDGKRQKGEDWSKPREQRVPGDGPSEPRRPKRKVAVMIGYSGTGYSGMQINAPARTIEGDLFAAFVAAGAISKDNADDPKKSSLVRCARTDKGVHAAGNVISLKLIVEDEDIKEKINANLSPQIRVWGIQRTNASFSSYNMCESRVYEYLVPSHVFLPPHPASNLGKFLRDEAEAEGELDAFNSRNGDAAEFWHTVDKEHITPLLEPLEDADRQEVLRAVFHEQNNSIEPKEVGATVANTARAVKAAILRVKKTYRMPTERVERIRKSFETYRGTHKFHNFTIEKSAKDPSAQRHVKSFTVSEPFVPSEKEGASGPRPQDPEYLSLKVHGQSFMMHQIRKMVSLAILSVRCASPDGIIKTCMSPTMRVSIPKAPGLGLLLERPIFDSYNKLAVEKFEREAIEFSKYDKEMLEFKEREIYKRIWREDEAGAVFSGFFDALDSHPSSKEFLWYLFSGHEKKAAAHQNEGDKTSRSADAQLSAQLEGQSGKDTEDGGIIEE